MTFMNEDSACKQISALAAFLAAVWTLKNETDSIIGSTLHFDIEIFDINLKAHTFMKLKITQIYCLFALSRRKCQYEKNLFSVNSACIRYWKCMIEEESRKTKDIIFESFQGNNILLFLYDSTPEGHPPIWALWNLWMPSALTAP